MSKEFKNVTEFNREIINLEQVEYLNQERLEWFKTTINEELGEFEKANKSYILAKEANEDEDILLECHVDMIDAIMDLIYFALGRLYEIGVDDDDFNAMWDAIHTANMTKKRGNKGRGSDADAIKPEGWQGPEKRFIAYKKSRKDDKNQLVTREQTPCDKNKTDETNGIQFQNIHQDDEKSLFNITKGRTTTLKDYYNNGCTVPSVKLEGCVTGRIPCKSENIQQLHLPGMKYDEGKPNLSLVFGGFSKALQDVGHVGTFGAHKYTPNGWREVPDLEERYMSALLRHTMSTLDSEPFDKETGRHHLAHVAWNALAILEHLFATKLEYDTYNKSALSMSEHTLKQHFENKKGKANG